MKPVTDLTPTIWVMRFPPLIVSILFVLICLGIVGCGPVISRDEVARMSSPDGRLDAIVFETNGGATTSFGYKVEVAKKGSRSGTEGANLYGAVRNAQAYGVNIRWGW